MEFLIPTTPISIAITCLIVLFVIFQIYIDYREISKNNRLYRELLAIAKKTSERSFTVVIELYDNVNSILPLINHLYGHGYEKLEVVVVIKKTANKNARVILNRYKKANDLKQFKIVSEVLNQGMEGVLRRNCTGVLALIMDKDDRLSKRFFELASVEALYAENHMIVVPRYHIRLNETITSALQAQTSVLYQLFFRLFRFKVPIWPLHTGIIYNRQAILIDEVRKDVVKTYVSQRLFISSPAKKKMREYFASSINEVVRILGTVKRFIALMVLLAIAATGVFFIKPNDLNLLIGFFAMAYIFGCITMQLRLNGYSVIDRINLALITPFSLMFVITVSILGLFKITFKLLRRQLSLA